MNTTKPSVVMNSNFVNMNVTQTAHRKRHHPRITQIQPPTPEFIACLQWMLDFYQFYAISGCKEASYDYADSLIPSSWNNADPQCARSWNGSAPVEQPYEPWSGDYSDAEPAWRREDWVGA